MARFAGFRVAGSQYSTLVPFNADAVAYIQNPIKLDNGPWQVTIVFSGGATIDVLLDNVWFHPGGQAGWPGMQPSAPSYGPIPAAATPEQVLHAAAVYLEKGGRL